MPRKTAANGKSPVRMRDTAGWPHFREAILIWLANDRATRTTKPTKYYPHNTRGHYICHNVAAHFAKSCGWLT